jgi:Ca2+-binding RTX toxin-like protein
LSLYVSPLLTEQSWIFGGAGNDIFYADGGNSALVGGSGSNMPLSGRGRNILIGGSGDSCTKRVGCLNGTMAGGLNVLHGTTIDHGTNCDYLFGAIRQNTCFARQTGRVLARDYVFGQKSSEQVTCI